MQPKKSISILFLIIIIAILITVILTLNWDRQTTSNESLTLTLTPGPTAAALSPVVEVDRPSATPAPPLEVQLAWFYKPPEESLLQALPQNFDFFILTHKDEQQRDRLRSLGVNAPIIQYLLLTEIRATRNCTEVPRGNQVAFHAGDFCMIDSQHPDWFLLDEHGKRIGGGEVHWMDPGNPGFREFWLDRARELQEEYGWDGIFMDNANASLGKFRSLGQLPQKYKSDQEYQAAVKGFLEYIRANYFLPSGRKMYANIATVNDHEVWHDYLDALDGVMVENFAAGWMGRNKSRAEWEEQMNALEEAHSRGKITILVAQGEQDDIKRQKFSFASYLLIANHLSFFRYASGDAYEQIWLYEDYNLELGPPLSPRYREGTKWRRDFLNGYVIVHPATLDAQIVLTR